MALKDWATAQLRAEAVRRRLPTREEMRYRQADLAEWRHRPLPGFRTVKSTLAAVTAYVLALLIPGDPQPVLAPLTALLVVQLTVYATVRTGIQRVASVVAGVVLATLVSDWVGLTWWSLAVVVFAALVIGRQLRLGENVLEVPISAMLVLSVGGLHSVAVERVYETLIGAAVGAVVNVVLRPPVFIQSAGDAVGELGGRMAQWAREVGSDVLSAWSVEHAHQWLERARDLDASVLEARAAVGQGEDSPRLNPRRRRIGDATLSLRAGLAALEHAVIQLRGIARCLADLAESYGDDGEPSTEVRGVLGLLLDDIGNAIVYFTELVAPDVTGPARDSRPVRDYVSQARLHRTDLMRALPVDAQGDPELWRIYGALLVNVDRLLREIDLDTGVDARAVRRR